jgi:hypothetical protein
MWLGYYTLPHPPELTSAFRTETRALLVDVVFDRDAPWHELFTADGTYADDYLAGYDGLPLPHSDEPVWLPYGATYSGSAPAGASGRQGILSHGSFLSVNAKFGDTSPTLRGKLVRERLLCQKVLPPPPDVNVDVPPGGDDSPSCKVDRYAEHRPNGSCAGCHNQLDPIGFGLEAFDQNGLFRETDVGKPECPIDGVGDLDGTSFVGPGGLADLLVAGDELDACAARQTYRLAMGHDATDDDAPYLDRITKEFRDDGRMSDLLLTLVTDDAFRYRREEEVTP